MGITVSSRDAYIAAHLREPVRRAFRIEAAKQGISVSALVSQVVEEFLQAKGYSLADEPDDRQSRLFP